jgi:hypothetical protein
MWSKMMQGAQNAPGAMGQQNSMMGSLGSAMGQASQYNPSAMSGMLGQMNSAMGQASQGGANPYAMPSGMSTQGVTPAQQGMANQAQGQSPGLGQQQRALAANALRSRM